MASTNKLFALSLLLLSLSSLSPSSSALPSSAILDAAEILSTSGFDAMAFNLELASHTLSSPPPSSPKQTISVSLTVFAPADFAFGQLPHLPLSLLRYHLLPHAFSLHSLTSLPFGANIPTLLPGHSLTITTTPHHHHHHRLSINNITVNPSPVFDDGRLIIFQTESFFDPYFDLPATTTPRGTNRGVTTAPSACSPPKKSGGKLYPSESAASGVLRSSGCSVMASLLEIQFLGLQNRPPLTLFAPTDESVASLVRNLSDSASVFRRHLVPCRISWSDLVKLEDGTSISTFEEGFALNVTRSGSSDTVFLNGVPVVSRELYRSDWLVVHGLREALSKDSDQISPPKGEKHGKEFSFGAENTAAHYHFSAFH